ncbi:MAG TPA: hypothetical protein VK048_02685 [Atopostipes sp.]|nr:hypothetical protein [Atopostipes sp.]
MINFKQITVEEAMGMIANNDLDNLYFSSSEDEVACVKNYQTTFSSLSKKTYFKKEEIETRPSFKIRPEGSI